MANRLHNKLSREMVLILGIFILSVPGKTQNAINQSYRQESGYENIWLKIGKLNSAIISYFPFESFTHICATGAVHNRGKMHYSWDGDQQTEIKMNAHGFVKGEKTSAIGEATYSRGLKQNVRWTNITDQSRTGPYQMADTTGGDTYYETYKISGNIAHSTTFGAWGIYGSYRAKGTYRLRDPRPLTTVSDVEAGGGTVFRFSDRLLGLAASAGIYYQNVQIKIYGDDRKDMIYFLTGLGQNNAKITGTDANESMSYTGSRYSLSAHIIPIKFINGWFGAVTFSNEKTNANYQKITPGIFQMKQIKLWSGYRWKKTNTLYHIDVQWLCLKGIGTEQYYETIEVDEETGSTNPRLLSRSPKYKNDFSRIHLSGYAIIKDEKKKIVPHLKSGISFHSKEYKTTPYHQSANIWFTEASCQISQQWATSTGVVGIITEYRHPVYETLVSAESIISKQKIIPNHIYGTAKSIKLGIQLQYQFQTNKKHNIHIVFDGAGIHSKIGNSQAFHFGIIYAL